MEKTKMKTIKTSLDSLPDGAEQVENQETKVKKVPIPQGVSKRNLIRDVILIALPSLLELLLTQLTSMADQVMVGRLPGVEGIIALSAVGLATQPKFLMMTLMQSLCVGETAVIARYRGQKNQEKVQQLYRQMMILNFFIGIIFAVIGTVTSEHLIRFMSGGGVSEETIQKAVEYLRIQMYGFLPLTLTFTTTAALRGIGDNRIPLIYNTIANAVNLFFNYAMIYGKLGCPAMGVTGASIATVIGQTTATTVALVIVLSGRHYIHLNLRKLKEFDWSLMGKVVKIGFPAMLEQLFMRTGVIIYSRVVAGLGDVMNATHQICMSIQALSFMMGQAFASATTTLMGQSLGKRRNDMAMIYMRFARFLGCIVSLILAAIMILFSEEIVGIYNSDAAVIQAGSGILILIAASQPIQSAQFIVSGGLRGAGDTKHTAMIILITTLGVRTVLSILAVNVLHWGLWGAWIALMADQCLRSWLMVRRYNSGKWIYIWSQTKGKNSAQKA